MKKIFTFFLAISFFGIFAREYDNIVVLKKDGTLPVIVAGEELISQSDRYNELFIETDPLLVTDGSVIKDEKERGFIVNNPFGLVMLEIPQIGATQNAGELTVEVEIEYFYNELNRLRSAKETVMLTVNANADDFKNVDYIKIDGAIRVNVTVLNVSSSLGNYDNVSLIASCRGQYYDMLSPLATVQSAVYNLGVDDKPVEGNLDITWDKDVVYDALTMTPEAYELEWTYSSNPKGIDAIKLRDFIFRNNSSRVVTTDNKYSIPLVYEKGVIIFRVRAIGKNVSDGKLVNVKSAWTLEESQNTLSELKNDDPLSRAYYYEYEGLEINLNWQSTITFAEEGKNKAVVTYHDGSLRNRQAVTRINTDRRVVVGESYYDYNGRPVIQVLPAPASKEENGEADNDFDFRPGFNLIEDSDIMQKADYATGNPGESCDPTTPAFSDKTGASKYYSTFNGFDGEEELNFGGDIINRDLIPDAEKHPYTQIVYRNDNTDRIIFQSGVGNAHTIGSGHETTYMYGAPMQSEISRLFGNQVGLSGHYKKNTIIDPNGQASVSYMNPEGKVIATALTGTNVTNLEALEGESSRSIETQLLSVSSNKEKGNNQKVYTSKIPVASATDYNFHYILTPASHQVVCENEDGTDITLDLLGVFNVNLTLLDDCGEQVFSRTIETDAGFGLKGDLEDVELSGKSYTIDEPNVRLEKGEHTLTKTLTINEEKLDDYLTEYLLNEDYTCASVEVDFAVAEDEIDLGGCNLNCSTCLERIEETIQGVEDMGVTIDPAQKDELFGRCDALCLDNLTCKAGLFAMMANMGPEGQYGGLREKDPALASATKPIDKDDPEGSIEENDPDRDIETTTDSNGDPSLKIGTSPAFVPSAYPLSVFNDRNRLLPNFFLRAAIPELLIFSPSWRLPIGVATVNYTGSNFINQSMIEADITNATYSITDYYSTSGEKIYARIIKSEEDGTYSPEILNEERLERIEDEFENGDEVYQIPIRNLKHLVDFYGFWQAHFVNYLVPYHPEFGYYVECTGRKAVNEYKEILIDIRNPQDVLKIGDLSVEGIEIDGKGFEGGDFLKVEDENALVPERRFMSAVLEGDPIFSQSNFVDQVLVIGLKRKVESFSKKFDAEGIELDPVEYYNMAQKATQVIGCPNPSAECKIATCEEGTFGNFDEAEFAMFKAFYLTARDSVIKVLSSEAAGFGMYHNGCIGNTNFLNRADVDLTSFHLFGTLGNVVDITSDPRVSRLPTKASFAAFEWMRLYGCFRIEDDDVGVKNCIGAAIRLTNRGGYSLQQAPLRDLNQTCNLAFSRLYKNKSRIFYNTVPLEENVIHPNANINVQSCFEIVKDVAGKSTFLEGTCNLAIVDKIEVINNKEEVRIFETCKYCPIVDYSKDFTTDLIRNNVFSRDITNFNCVSNTPNFQLGLELGSKISTNVRNETFDWSGDYDESSKTLTGTVTGDLQGDKLEFEYDFSDFGPGDLTEAEFETLIANSYVAGVELGEEINDVVYSFSIELNPWTNSAVYVDLIKILERVSGFQTKVGTDRPTTYTVEVPTKISKVISESEEDPIDLRDCSFGPVCEVNRFGAEVMSFLNAVTYETPEELEEEISEEQEQEDIDDAFAFFNNQEFDIEGIDELFNGLSNTNVDEELIEDLNPALLIKDNDLTATEPVNILDFSYYENPVRELINKTEFNDDDTPVVELNDLNATWVRTDEDNGMYPTNSLRGAFSYTEMIDGVDFDRKIEINIQPALIQDVVNTFDFNKVFQFRNIRPFVDDNAECPEGTCSSPMFYADVVVFDKNSPLVNGAAAAEGSEYAIFYRVAISVETFTNGVSDASQPSITTCEYIDVTSGN